MKSTDPNPVAGSQPGAAAKPCSQHSAGIQNPAPVQLLLPDVMSFANDPLLAYRVGFNQPKVGLPAAFLAALTRETMPPKAGVDKEVPEATYFPPPRITR